MRLRLALPRCVAFGSALCLLAGLRASAEEIVLRPRYHAGDVYVLALSAVKNAEMSSRGEKRRPFREDVHLRYEANVRVLETDAAGIPLRERHQDVVLSFVRPDASGSLFAEKTSYEVRRADGEVQLFVRGERAERKLEQVVADVLESQFEYGIGALVDPGRPVGIGESWEIEPARVRSYLHARGVEAARFDEPATATLEPRRSDGATLVLRYRIPIASFEPSALPPNARAASSDGSLEGELLLDPAALRTPLRHSSKLALRMNGSVHGQGVAPSFPWRFRKTESLDQHTLTVRREVAAR